MIISQVSYRTNGPLVLFEMGLNGVYILWTYIPDDRSIVLVNALQHTCSCFKLKSIEIRLKTAAVQTTKSMF